MTRGRIFIACVAAGSVTALAGVLVYLYVEARATAAARLALRSDGTVRVRVRAQDVLFEPASVTRRAAARLLFLPLGPPLHTFDTRPAAESEIRCRVLESNLFA